MENTITLPALTLTRTITVATDDCETVTRILESEDRDWRIIETREMSYGGESWYRKIVMALPEGTIGPRPEGACETPYAGMPACSSRRPCETCYSESEWQSEAIGLACDLLDTAMYGFAGGPGRKFANDPWARWKGKRLVITQHGGLDI